MSLSRTTASKFKKQAASVAGVVAALLGFAAVPALAQEPPPAKPAPSAKNAELAVCPGQTFSQPFEAQHDANYYTLVEGSEFNGTEGAWELSRGAALVQATRPDESGGPVLDLPSGGEAVSPPVCVTLNYPTARMYVQNLSGGGVAVSVAYAGTKTEEAPKAVGQLKGPRGAWAPSAPFQVQPQLAGHDEEVRQVRFHFTQQAKDSENRLFGLYVDPRMR